MGTYLTIKESWFDLVWLIFDVSFVKEILLNTHPEFEHIQIRNRSTNKIRIIQISQTQNKQKIKKKGERVRKIMYQKKKKMIAPK